MKCTMESEESKVPFLAAMLGYAGLIPFLVFAVGLWIVPPVLTEMFDKALLTYAACILAFMGAIHWGAAMNGSVNSWQLGISVVPALVAWLALNISTSWDYSILIIGFALLCVVDSLATRRKLFPEWYPRLRIPLTSVVILSLISGALAS